MSVKNILYLFYGLIPLAIYHFPVGGLNLSLDRLMLVVIMLSFVMYRFKGVPDLAATSFILFATTIMSVVLASSFQMEGLIKYGPSWFQSIFVFFVSSIFAFKFGEDFVKRIAKIHFWIFLICTLYGFYYRYFLDTMNFEYPLSSFLPNLNEDQHKVGMLYHKRLFFPLSSAPRLGFMAGILFIFFSFYLNRSKKKWFFLLASLFVLIVTISRGPIVSLILAFAMGYLIKNFFRGRLVYQVIILVSIIGLLYLAFQFMEGQLIEGSKFSRIFDLGSEEDASFEGHLNVRIKVVEYIFGGDFVNLFFGYGFGQLAYHLFVSSAHSSYFTILFEQGLVGVFALGLVYVLMIVKTWKLYIKYPSKQAFGLFVMSLFLTLVHLVYDAFTLVILWAYVGFVWGLSYFFKRKYAS